MVAGLGLGTNGNAQTLSAPEIPDIEAPAYKYCRTIDHDGMGKTVCFPPDGPNRSGLPYNVIPNYTSFGMNDLRTEHIADETYPLSQADLDRIEQLGTRVLRVPFFSDRDNAWLDGIVREAAERGITILPILANRGWYPPTTEGERASFRTFVSRVSTRYGILDDGRPGWFWQGNTSVAPHPIVAWEIWNEPNLYEFWKAPPGGAQTAEYGRLLLDAASELRLSRYNRLVLGGLSDQPYFDRSLGIQPHQFVKEALDYASATGGRHRACYIDAVGLHPYGQTDLASPQRSADSAFSSLAAIYFSLNHPDIINLPRTPT